MRPGVGVYRPNTNPVLEYAQYHGRCASNKYLVDRMDVKGMIKALRNGDALWYAPDHDYGSHASVFVPYFAVEQAATITGTATLARVKNTVTLPCYNIRTKEGYTLHIGRRWKATRAATIWPTPAAPTARSRPPCARPRSSTCGCTAASRPVPARKIPVTTDRGIHRCFKTRLTRRMPVTTGRHSPSPKTRFDPEDAGYYWETFITSPRPASTGGSGLLPMGLSYQPQ